MSTLTKVLIVLLTISSIFLCGIVVTYVANAVDYKDKYDELDQSYRAAKKNEENARKKLNEQTNKAEEDKLQSANEIAALQVQAGELENKLIEEESSAA